MGSTDQHTPISLLPRPDGPTRDRQLVGFAARHGVVTIEQAMAALGVGRASAYRRVAHCVERGLIERLELLRREPSLLRATRRGLRLAGFGLPPAVVSPGSVDHWLRCVDVALHLEATAGDFGDGNSSPDDGDRVRFQTVTERELALAERTEGRPLLGARVARNGRDGFHRPDLAILTGSEVIAIEVELSVKAPRRLEAIMRGWRRADRVDRVRYFCPPGPVHRAVARAIEKTYSAEKVTIEGLPR